MSDDAVAPGGAAAVVRRRSSPVALLVAMRPKQWIKNLFVLAPPLFAGVFGLGVGLRVALAFAAFCLVASSLYLVNDVVDREADRLHWRKRRRPIASGELGVPAAIAAAVVTQAAGLALAALAAPGAGLLAVAYTVTTLAYSFWLKRVAILDVLLIASGFVIRVGAGAYAAGVPPSEWLLLCTLFLALFLGFAKRYHELLLLSDDAHAHRVSLADYSPELLRQFLTATMLGSLMSYAMYALLYAGPIHHPILIATIPFAVYGIFRYQLLVETRREGGSPEEMLLTDLPLQLAGVLWALTAGFAVYFDRIF